MSDLDFDAVRRRLAGTRGREYWRSLEEAAGHPEFARLMAEEFPDAEGWDDPGIDRRRVLQVMAACVALASVSGCGPEKTQKRLLPYVHEPQGLVAAVPRYYASAVAFGGFAEGVLVKHYMGRPIKIEGNPDHPASLGATSHWSQASLLSLYDPERSQLPLQRGQPASEEEFVAALAERRADLLRTHGQGLRILSGTVTSPTLVAQMQALAHAFPEARWHRWEAIGRDTVADGAQQAFGRPLDPILHLDAADVVLAVGSDVLSSAPGHLRYARDFAAKRRAAETHGQMSRVYAIDATPSLAGSVADHRLVLQPDDIVLALGSLAVALKAAPDGFAPAPSPWLAAVARDLGAHRGAALVHAGPELPAEAHVLAHAINDALGSHGRTVEMIEPVAAGGAGQPGSLTELVRDMQAGKVDTLLILDGNPVFAAPSDLDFAAALGRVPFAVHLGPYVDETAQRCAWHLPETHELEAWSDARAYDGTASIIQPQVRPLYRGRSRHEILDLLLGSLSPDGMRLVQNTWREQQGREQNFDEFWRAALRRGVIPETGSKPVDVDLRRDAVTALKLPARAAETATVLFRPDEGLWDGRFANNGWLQEMPRWHTKIVWDNAALIAPRTAERLGLHSDDVVEIRSGERSIQMPVWVLPGQAENCVTLPLGFGRSVVGNVGQGAGFNPYPLRASDALWQRADVTLRPIGRRYHLVSSQHEWTMAGRDMVISAPLDQFRNDPEFLHKVDEHDPEAPRRSLYPPYPSAEGNAWAMAINLNSCIGCSACVVACAAENNTPVVGKEEADRGRLMQWLRIDRYYSGDFDVPDTFFQPVPCMHCQDAPCEVVCPVQATMTDSDGLNVMVYNRCVGTRFCSNNCPYKVRRFNFFGFAHSDPRLPEAWNPDVTVRGRGVMEKCTYCIQRIREAKIASSRDRRTIHDGEVVTACQAACPTQAIVFGDLNDPHSAVNARKASPLDYSLLPELNTHPRTTYEAHLRNVNPDLAEE